MQSFDFQVVLNAPLERVFAVYLDVERWRNRNQFGEIRWIKGRPWAVGSRLHIEIQSPIRTSVEQVVQHFTPNESVSYVSEVLGITCEMRVTFSAVSERQTAINVVMQLVGSASRALDFAVAPMLRQTVKGLFEELRKECDKPSLRADGILLP